MALERKPKILYAEDEADIQLAVAKRLELSGFEVIIANDGQEALDKAQSENPDLFILDVMMPVLSGLEVCAKLRNDERFQKTPIVIMTCRGQEGLKQQCHELKVDAFIDKIVGVKPLIEEINSLLGLSDKSDNK